jgi:very-short-patch-repair endonuclease
LGVGDKMAQFKESNRTFAEKRLGVALKEKKIYFKHNQKIAGYEVDFWFPDSRLVIEVDGFTHLSNQQSKLDQIKDQSLTAKGIRVLRISNQQIREHLNDCLNEIVRTIKLLKEFQNNKGQINDQWKKQLTKIKIVEPEPIKKYKTIEEYFLCSEDKSE